MLVRILSNFLCCIVIIFNTTHMEAHDLLKETEFIIHPTSLMLELPEDLANKPLCRLRTLALQKDTWSCGYHALFNAKAIDQGLEENLEFEESLKKNLTNQKLFEKTLETAFAHTKKNKPLDGHEIMEICKKLSLQNKAISLFLTEKNEFMIPNLYARVEHQKTATKQEIEELLHAKRKEIVTEKITGLVKSLQKNNKAGYFICNVGNHWVLFSIIRHQENAKLYLIGAWNEPINETMRIYINKFLEYVHLFNEKKLISFYFLFSQCAQLLT